MTINITEIVVALIGLLGVVITGVLVPYIRSRTSSEQRANIYTLVMLAVQAAEQIYFKPGQGEKKKQFVINYLSSKGIKLTIEDLNIMIEAAVKELNLIQKDFLPPADALD